MSREVASPLTETAIEAEWKHLTALGPRFPGTAAENATVEYLVSQLQALPLSVREHEYRYLGWNLLRPPTLKLLAPVQEEIEALAFMYCGPTPKGGVSGRLEYLGDHWVIGLYKWPKFAIRGENGQLLGYVSGRPDGPPIPQPLAESSSVVPHFIIGTGDLHRFLHWRDKGMEIRVQGEIACRINPAARSRNVVARYEPPAPGERRVALCAHMDSVYICPGANDNAGGLVAVLALARHYSAVRPPFPMDFLFFCGEEWDLAGSKAYVAEHITPEVARQYKMLMNLDGIAEASRNLQVWVGPEPFEEELREAIESFRHPMHPEVRRIYKYPPPPGSDHLPFYQLGIPVTMLTGFDMVKYHRPVDICHPDGLRSIAYVAALTRHIVDSFQGRDPVYITKASTLAPYRGTQWELTLSQKFY